MRYIISQKYKMINIIFEEEELKELIPAQEEVCALFQREMQELIDEYGEDVKKEEHKHYRTYIRRMHDIRDGEDVLNNLKSGGFLESRITDYWHSDMQYWVIRRITEGLKDKIINTIKTVIENELSYLYTDEERTKLLTTLDIYRKNF